MNEEEKIPRKGPANHSNEKAKDFKGSILRLIKELKSFKLLIIISLVLAALGSILSIFTPNLLSDLTDEISKGLIVNQKNLEVLSTNIQNSLTEEKMTTEIPKILDFNLSQEKINYVLTSSEISDEDKSTFMNIINNINPENMDKIIYSIPESILKIMLNETVYNGVTVSIDDKITLLNILKEEDKTKIKLPNNIYKILLEEFEIDGVNITKEDQIETINIMSNMSDSSNVNDLYKQIDEMPDSVQKVVEPVMNLKTIKNIALILVIMYLFSALFTYIESLSMTIVSNKFAKSLRSSISSKINVLPLKYFDHHSIGNTLSRVTNDVDTIAQSMNQSLATLVSAITLFIGSIIMMFYTNWIMSITAILSSLIGFAFMSVVLSKSQKYFNERQKGLGELNGHIEEVYSGLNIVKVYNGIEQSDMKFDELNDKLYDANRKSMFLSGLMMPMMSFIGNFSYVAVCIVGALLTLNGSISFGVIVAFISYVRLFTSPLSQIAQAMTSLQSTAASSERVFEFLDEDEMDDQKNIHTILNKEDVKGEITFEHVKFGYNEDKIIIKDFNAKALPGQKIAIVGPTGAGKTTMVNLLMKFYEINSGNIKIDGIPINELSRENIHSLFTMVLQDTWLFNGTVKENIIYNRENVSDERVKEVCKTVGLDHFIRTLPNGYNSNISDNDSVSSGQRQLITIARGMIEDAPFLILDEATSNVDTRTEELVQKAMDKLTVGKTSFIIAHRLSTIKNADLILVMKDGNIIEQGNHDELMHLNGFYSELYNSQFKK